VNQIEVKKSWYLAAAYVDNTVPVARGMFLSSICSLVTSGYWKLARGARPSIPVYNITNHWIPAESKLLMIGYFKAAPLS
jgi:hypothetical protein